MSNQRKLVEELYLICAEPEKVRRAVLTRAIVFAVFALCILVYVWGKKPAFASGLLWLTVGVFLHSVLNEVGRLVAFPILAPYLDREKLAQDYVDLQAETTPAEKRKKLLMLVLICLISGVGSYITLYLRSHVGRN